MAKSTSIKFARDEAAALAEPLPEPPLPLAPEALQHWPTIIGAKRRSAWGSSDLILACHLARDIALVDQLAADLERYGPTLENDKGRRYPNPSASILDATQRRILATTRNLQIHSLATQGRPDANTKKNAASRELADHLASVSHLIARPKA